MTPRRDIWAVVPVKALGEAKTRLAPALPAPARVALARAMLEDVLDALASVRTLAGMVVVTVDPVAEAVAQRHGARVFGDDANAGHTRAVTAAARRLAAERREGMLTLPGDIPGLRHEEVEALLGRHGAAPAFTIVPAHDGRGSNAIVISPPNAVPLAFGNDSFLPHVAAARATGIEPVIARGLDGIALDIDCGADVAALLRAGRPSRARTLLLRLPA